MGGCTSICGVLVEINSGRKADVKASATVRSQNFQASPGEAECGLWPVHVNPTRLE